MILQILVVILDKDFLKLGKVMARIEGLLGQVADDGLFVHFSFSFLKYKTRRFLGIEPEKPSYYCISIGMKICQEKNEESFPSGGLLLVIELTVFSKLSLERE